MTPNFPLRADLEPLPRQNRVTPWVVWAMGTGKSHQIVVCMAILTNEVPAMLTMKAKYGLKALADLAQVPEGEMLQTREIAEAHGISKKFLDSIMAELRVAGILKARKGPGGGFALARPADQIFVGNVVRVLDGPLAPIACASRTAYVACTDCPDQATCAVRRTMLEVREAIAAVLDSKSLAAFIAAPSVAAA